MITDIQEFNDTLIKDLEHTKMYSFQCLLRITGLKRITFDSDQLLSYKIKDNGDCKE